MSGPIYFDPSSHAMFNTVKVQTCSGQPLEVNPNPINNPGASTAFGEYSFETTTPVFQLDGLYGISDTDDFQLNSALSGSQSVDSNGLMSVSTGTTAGSFATLRSKRSIRYRPGQGSMSRFTAMFPNGHVAGYQQVAGYLNQSDIIGVGYNYPSDKTSFGILRRNGSKGEIYKVSIGAGASGAEVVRITLNDVVFDVNVTSGTAAFNAAELASASYTRWIVDIVGTDIYFLYDGGPGDLTGTFACENTTQGGTLTCTGTTLENGAAGNDEWVYQTDWNVDQLDGTGPSGMTLDPTKLNVFQIDFRWLGAGIIRWSIEDEATGNLIPFHILHYVNKNIKPHVSNPSLRVGYGVINAAPAVGSNTDVVVKGGSMMGAIQGKIAINRTTRAVSNTLNNLSATDVHHVISLKNDRINEDGTNGKLNQREVIIQTLAVGALANAGNLATFYIYKGAAITDGAQTPADVNFQWTASSSNASSTTTTGEYKADSGELVTCAIVSADTSANLDMTPYRVVLAPLETINVFVSCPAQVSPSVSLTFVTE